MKMISSLRGGFLLTSACAVLAACSGSGEVQNAGTTGPVTVNPGTNPNPTNTADNILDFTVAACPTGTSETTRTLGAKQITACEITGSRVVGNLTIGGDGNVYSIAPGTSLSIGDNLISNATGTPGTLTILPGTILFGADSESTLVVSPGSQIIADGTITDPIIMTSANDLFDADRSDAEGGDLTALEAVNDGLSAGSATARGEWGGLVINGLAPINACPGITGGTAACTKEGEGFSGLFGGDQPTDDSGILDYVRVQFPGNNFSTTNELNGIAFQGVGSGTQVTNVQVHNSSDDGVEFFGGTVSVSNLVLTGNGDDSMDWTDGWSGSAQFVVIVHTDGDADNGFEGDNFGDDADATPQSTPVVSNFTIIGLPSDPEGESDDGMELRAGTGGTFLNGIVANMGEKGLDYTAEGSLTGPTLDSTIFAGNSGRQVDTDAETQALFNGGANNRENAANSLDGLFTGNIEEATTPTALTDPRLDAAGGSHVGAFAYNVRAISESFLDRWTLQAPLPASQGDGCPTGTSESPADAGLVAARTESRVCTLTGVIETDVTLTRGNLYKLVGATFVGRDIDQPGGVSAQLRIDAGVTVYGADSESYLVATRGSQLFVNGTQESPVVMTALADIQGTATATDRGLWGGLVLNGRAPINACPGITGGTSDCVKDGEGFSGLFGGTESGDSSGSLTYLQVRYPGNNFSTTNELNGIAFQGVGNGTVVDYVEVYNSSDDGVEFFGGTVNASHLVLIGNGDDSLDWTDGWTGNVQFVIIGHTDGDADNGFEGDNFGDDADATPQSTPTIANYTIIGLPSDAEGESDDGMELRAGTAGEFYNGIVVNMGEKGIDYTAEGALGGPLMDGVKFGGNGTVANAPFRNVDTDAETQALFNAGTENRDLGTVVPLVADSEGSAFNLVPDFSAAPAGSDAAVTVDEDRDAMTANTFIVDADYVGAVADDSDNWYVGWTFGL
ncbi:MAG: hypothetical protein AAGA69_04025 [Pseudomonadota bacterium]